MIACIVSVRDGGIREGRIALGLRRPSSEHDQSPRWKVEV